MQWSKSGVVGLLALCAAVASGACGAKGGGGGSASAAASSTPSTTSSTKTADSAATAKPTETAKAEVKPEDVFKDDGEGKEEGILTVDLSQAKDDAPALGGTAAAPPPPPKGAELTWLSAGTLAIPNPGWKLEKKGELGFLGSPDTKGGLIFTGFKEQKEGLTKVDQIVAQMKLKEMRWKKPKPVTLGPDKVPALFGKGKAKDKDGKGVHLFYMLIKNQPENLLAIGGADDDGGEQSLKTALNIIGNIKKAKK